MRGRYVLAAGACAIGVAAIAGRAPGLEQTPAIRRVVLQKQALTIPGHEGIMVAVEMPPGTREGRHTHPQADLFVYVLEGTLTVEVDGKPARTLRAGDSAFTKAGTVHEAINASAAPVKLLAVFVTETGKPLTTPSP